jgi:hypothetical protein
MTALVPDPLDCFKGLGNFAFVVLEFLNPEIRRYTPSLAVRIAEASHPIGGKKLVDRYAQSVGPCIGVSPYDCGSAFDCPGHSLGSPSRWQNDLKGRRGKPKAEVIYIFMCAVILPIALHPIVACDRHSLSTGVNRTLQETMECPTQVVRQMRNFISPGAASRRDGLDPIKRQMPIVANRACYVRPAILTNPAIEVPQIFSHVEQGSQRSPGESAIAAQRRAGPRSTARPESGRSWRPFALNERRPDTGRRPPDTKGAA